MRVVVALILCVFAMASAPDLAIAGGWKVMRGQSGAPVARLETGDVTVPVIEFACDGEKLAIAVQAKVPANYRSLPIYFVGDLNSPVGINLPRLGNYQSFTGILPDSTVIDGLAGGWSKWRIVAGSRTFAPSLIGADGVVKEALINCYSPKSSRTEMVIPGVPTAAKAPGSAGRGIFQDASLPLILRNDLADFEHSCDYDFDQNYDLKSGARKGPALAASAALQRADFNGDGIDDYILDTAKLRCSRAKRNDQSVNGGKLLVYTSVDGGFIHSIDIAYDSWKMVAANKGKAAAIFVHQDFVPEDPNLPDGEGEAQPLVNETVSMTGPKVWGQSQLGRMDWRLGALSKYPQALRIEFARWDAACTAVGRRLDFSEETYGAFTINEAGDLNRDSRPDYVIDVEGLFCGVFGVAPVPAPPYFCGKSCMLIGIISAPGDAYVADRIQGSTTFAGNGDPAMIDQGKILWYAWDADPCFRWEVSYSGTTQVRRKVACPKY